MKKFYRTILAPVLFGLFFSVAANAGTPEEAEAQFQQSLLVLNKQRLEIITHTMEFTPKQAAGFWAVYEDYSAEMKKLQDEGASLLNDYFTDIGFGITDKTALELNIRSFDIAEKKVKIRRKYFPRFSEATNDSLAARFMQIDGMVDAAIELLIAQSLPEFPTKLNELLGSKGSELLNKF